MSISETLIDMGTALGKGVLSVAEDIYGGVERTAEGLGVRGADRMAEIGAENEYLVGHLMTLVGEATTNWESSLYKLVRLILQEYYQHFPESALREIADAAGVAGSYAVGRFVLGRMIARRIAVEIVHTIARSAAFRALAARLGISAGVGTTGVGLIVTVVMVQGLAQRASHASQRLKIRFPRFWGMLRSQEGLDMLYFLVEEPLAKYLDAIEHAQQSPEEFERTVLEHYQAYAP